MSPRKLETRLSWSQKVTGQGHELQKNALLYVLTCSIYYCSLNSADTWLKS